MRCAGIAAIGVVAFAAISIVWIEERRNPGPTTREVGETLDVKSQHSDWQQVGMAGEQPQSHKPSSAKVLSLEAAETDAQNRNEEPSEYFVEQEAEARAKLMAVLKLIYEDVASVAGLSNAEEESLIELLFGQHTEFFSSNADPVNSLDGAGAHNQMLARHRAEIAELVGSARAQAIFDYQKSTDARFQVEDLRRQLESAGMPITEEQRRGLIKAAIERGAYVPMPEFTGAGSEEAMGQELLARVQQRDQKMLELARSQLKTSQVIWYEDLLQQRYRTMEESLRASYADSR